MKAIVPEIAWHNKSPVFTVDIQPEINKTFYRAATGGGDFHIVIWHLVVKEDSSVSVEFAADLNRHIKAVNVVRFSKDSKFLASGDDDAVIILWALKDEQSSLNNSFTNDQENKENWSSVKVFRGHKDDIYDLCWSPNCAALFSGSVDNTAIVWNVEKGQSAGIIGEHHGFVQGVAWDPKGKCLATLCSDRALRLFDVNTRKMITKVNKVKINKVSGQDESDGDENLMRLFHDDTVKTFFRRLCFSPDGNLIFTPCGVHMDSVTDANPPKDVTYIFLKAKPDRPVFHLPSLDEYTVAVRCCPVLFELHPGDSNLFSLPYRIVFAIASRKSIVFYDTQQLPPFGVVKDIHYATLTDITWSPDGRLLLASSSDGYCTIVHFDEGELGVVYREESSTPQRTLGDALEDLGIEPIDQKQNGFADKEAEQTSDECENNKRKSQEKRSESANTEKKASDAQPMEVDVVNELSNATSHELP